MIPEGDILTGLKKLTEHGLKLRSVETAIGMPSNSLSRILKSGKLPGKYKIPLFELVKQKEIELILKRTEKLTTIELPKDFIGFNKIAIITDRGVVEELKGTVPDWAYQYMSVWTGVDELSSEIPYRWDGNKFQEIKQPENPKNEMVADLSKIKTFDQILSLAKSGINKEVVESAMRTAPLNANQIDLIKRKIQ